MLEFGSVETNPFYLRERWGAKGAIPQARRSGEPCSMGRGLKPGAILSECCCGHLVPNGIRKGCRDNFFFLLPPSAGTCGESCSCRTFPPLEPVQRNFAQGKNAGFISSPPLISVSTEPSSSSGVAREELNLWPGTQPSISRAVMETQIPGRQGNGLLGK